MSKVCYVNVVFYINININLLFLSYLTCVKKNINRFINIVIQSCYLDCNRNVLLTLSIVVVLCRLNAFDQRPKRLLTRNTVSERLSADRSRAHAPLVKVKQIVYAFGVTVIANKIVIESC